MTKTSSISINICSRGGWFAYNAKEDETRGRSIGAAGLFIGIILQYADDTLIFEEGSVKQALIIKSVLYCYEAWSRLKINFDKSSFVCLGKKSVSILLILEIFRCKEEKFPIKYLNIPIKLGRLSRGKIGPPMMLLRKSLRVGGGTHYLRGVE